MPAASVEKLTREDRYKRVIVRLKMMGDQKGRVKLAMFRRNRMIDFPNPRSHDLLVIWENWLDEHGG